MDCFGEWPRTLPNYAMTRIAQLYLIITSLAILGILAILHAGNQLTPPTRAPGTLPASAAEQTHITVPADASFFGAVQRTLQQNGTSPLSRLFVQLFIIISAPSVAGFLSTRIGQPAIVGEMIADWRLPLNVRGWNGAKRLATQTTGPNGHPR